jgi:hypothetical protein
MNEFTCIRLLTNGKEVECKIFAEDEKEAVSKYWESLEDYERDRTESIEVVMDFII